MFNQSNVGALEHANFTVSDPDKTAALLSDLFDWKVRWSGASKDNGYTVHVGSDSSYLALYSPGTPGKSGESNYKTINGLNHIAITVPDLDETERRARTAGLEPHNFGDYEPGKRFYFDDPDGIEFEVVSYPRRGRFYDNVFYK